MGIRFLYLVRHGQMAKGEPLDQLGNGLTALGQRQARWAARRFQGVPVSVIHHSPLRRAAETASIIGAQLPNAPLRVSPLLSEIIPGWPIHVRQYFQNTPAAEIERGRARAERALQKFFRPVRGADRHELIVAHGNIIRYFLLTVLGLRPKLWSQCDIHNCGLSEIRILPDGERLVIALNDTGHLPRQHRTFM